jgi:hypothetical protein
MLYDVKDSRTADVWTTRSTYSHRSTAGPRNTHIYSASNIFAPYITTVVFSVVFTHYVKITSPSPILLVDNFLLTSKHFLFSTMTHTIIKSQEY